jgi:hypothetical protein
MPDAKQEILDRSKLRQPAREQLAKPPTGGDLEKAGIPRFCLPDTLSPDVG